MPEGFSDWLPRGAILSYEEILRVVGVATGLGFRKFRVTGGEPLVRWDACEFVERLCATPGVETVSMTTNGTRLAPVAERLAKAGMKAVNISLDALDPEIYRKVTRGEVAEVLAGIEAAVGAGFEKVKLNVVLMKGLNEGELWPIVEYAAARRIAAVRFIELMPVSSLEMIGEDRFLSLNAAKKILGERDALVPLPDVRLGHGPAKYYELKKLGLRVGFIGAMTDEHFCETCNKVRLTADGFVRPCLGNHGEIDLKPGLRGGGDAVVEAALRRALDEKPRDHVFRDQYVPMRIMTAIGG
jgi:cyclic pyranopterin phosphate synthase